ncbi:MAG: hypothetical protein Q8M94_16155, partial [Ignavibacteria bacterium]|nr:hypothetical protein [Ignavibacteria bacterium]
FEVYDSSNKPDYWDTSGEVTDDARFDNAHSLQLNAGQYAEQKEVAGIGLPNPSWWSWSTGTRFSFRCRGHGGISKIRVKVYLDATLQTIWTWREKDGSYAIKESSTQLDFDINPDWKDSLITFACDGVISGKIKLRIENIHVTTEVFVDAVVVEPDINGRWPSDYSHGPKSISVTADLPDLTYGHVWAGDELNKALIQAPPPPISTQTGFEFLHLFRNELGRWRVKWRDIEAIIRDIGGFPPGRLVEIYIWLSYTLAKIPKKTLGTTGTITTQPNEDLIPLNKTDLAMSITRSSMLIVPIVTTATGIIDREIITSVA